MAEKYIAGGTDVIGSIRKDIDARFLNALDLIDFPDGLEVTIDKVQHHDVLKYQNGKSNDNVQLMYFKGTDKALKLNVTNRDRITIMLGTGNAEKWHGKKIKLHNETAYRPDIKGRGPCVRVMED